MSPNLLLLVFVCLALARPLLYKKVSMALDHESGPIFTSVWVVIGLLVVFPWYGHLLTETIGDMPAYLWGLLVLKGVFLWLLFYNGQALTRQSLSAAKFFLPTALGVIAIINVFLGETLEVQEWVAAFGLCVLGIVFSLRGHLQDLERSGKFLFYKLVCISILSASLDFIILKEVNWYVLLFTTNIFTFAVCVLRRNSLSLWKGALFRKEAVLAGSVFSIGELLKFYLMVSILPMTVVISAQVSIIPVVLILSALLWGERGWKEQLLWGVLSASLLLLLFL